MIEKLNTDLINIEESRNDINANYFYDFILALLKVDPKYLIWPYRGNKQMSERVFAYELYHQWRLVSKKFNYQNLLINAEIRKDGIINNLPTSTIVYPDLVLHEMQANMNQQIIACEIKTAKGIDSSNGKSNVKKDLVKLGDYIDSWKYEMCVFIQVKNSFNEFDKVIKYLKKKKNEFKNSDKIYYVIKESDFVKYDTLENLLR
jgi:hypothetical protein